MLSFIPWVLSYQLLWQAYHMIISNHFFLNLRIGKNRSVNLNIFLLCKALNCFTTRFVQNLNFHSIGSPLCGKGYEVCQRFPKYKIQPKLSGGFIFMRTCWARRKENKIKKGTRVKFQNRVKRKPSSEGIRTITCNSTRTGWEVSCSSN